MKKIFAVAVMALFMVSASSALALEAGAKFVAGQNVADGSSAKETVKSINADSNFEFGAAAYLNFALFGGLGVQIEPTLIKSNVSFGGNVQNGGATMTVNQDYDVMTLDIPVMVWLNLDLWKLTIGFGGGVDFSMDLNRDASFSDVAAAVQEKAKAAAEDASKTSFAWIVGADVKFYITKHIGIVGSARYIMDINKKDVPINVTVADYEIPTGASYPTIEYARRFLYGGVGLEFKFF